MKQKVNKLLAVFVCVAIMLSFSVPVMAISHEDDGCCDGHHSDTAVPGNSVTEPTGSSEQGGGSTDANPAPDNGDGEENKDPDTAVKGEENKDPADGNGDDGETKDPASGEGDKTESATINKDDDGTNDEPVGIMALSDNSATDLCLCADSSDACTCDDCTCADCICADCNTISNAIISGISAMAGFMPFSVGTTYTWQQILTNFFSPGSGGGATTTTAVTDGITITGRAANHEGVGINISALRNHAPSSDASIVITGSVTGTASWMVFEVWRGGEWDDNVQGNSTSITIPSATDYATGTNHRLTINSNGAAATEFKITGITVGGVSIVASSGAPTLTGNHSTFIRAGKDIIYSLNVSGGTHPFVANGTAPISVQNNTFVQTTVVASGANGITIPAAVFNNAQAGDILEVRGRIINNRLGGGRLALFNGTGAEYGDGRANTDLVSPWTISFTLDAAALSGMSLNPNRWGGDNTDFTFSIDDMIIHRPSGVPFTGNSLFNANGTLKAGFTLNNATIDNTGNAPMVQISGAQNWVGLEIARAGLTEGSTITITYSVDGTTSGGTWGPRMDIVYNGSWTADVLMHGLAIGENRATATATVTAASLANATHDFRIIRHGDAGRFENVILSIHDVVISSPCPNLANHTNLNIFPAATCTADAVACSLCGHQNAPISSYGGHTFTQHNTTQHKCNRNVNGAECGYLENCSPNNPGDTCTTCNNTRPTDGHVCTEHWGSWGATTATCTAAGTSIRNCTVSGCPNIQSRNDSPLGHNVQNGVCTRCNLTPCGMCGVVGPWRWGGNAESHWAGNCDCTGFAPHVFNANGVCICGRTGTPSIPPSACGMCGVVGNWKWGGNADVHWADDCNCPGNAPHVFNSQGVCICGRTGTPGSGGSDAAESACAMCGVVGPWRWGGNADVHWAANCSCTGNAPHVFNAQGVCICGATGTPGSSNSATASPCAMCGVVGDWRWGGNADVHWAANCSCTGNAPHVFNAQGVCICGETRTVVPPPQDAFNEEDFIDAGALIDDLQRAIDAGETPTIDLTNAGNLTIIDSNVLLAIKASGVDVVVVLPSGYTFTIIAASISDDVGAFDLNIDVITKYVTTLVETIGGGKVDVSANSIVFMPNFHGEFGFDIVFHVTPEQLDDAGISTEGIQRFHVCAVGNVTDKEEPTVNDDGSVNFTIDHASFHVLSNDRPITTETGSAIIGSEVPGTDTQNIGEQGGSGGAIEQIGQALTQQSGGNSMFEILISAAAILVAVFAIACATLALIKRRNSGRAA